jgi:hypothetical protein
MKNVECRNEGVSRNGGWFRAIRHSLFVLFLGIVCLGFPAKTFAQSSNRWLLVFNTSASMRDRTQAVEAVAVDLLTTAMHGTIRPGDTIGIWTFNTELHADEAPLQTWYPNTAPAIAQNTLAFLHQHPYEKTAVFGDVLTNMLRVIKMSDVITVILISDGTDPIKGTPFDAQISAFYKTNYQAQKKAHMPFVTVFRGDKGNVTSNTMALGQWPANIPDVPPPPVVKAIVQKPVPVAPPKPVPSLVIIGSKAETTFNPPTDLPEHVDQPTRPAAVEQKPVETKAEVSAPKPEPAPKVEEKPTPVVVPVAAAPVASEPAKPVQPAAPVATTAPATNQTPATVAQSVAPVQTAAVVPERNLLSVRNIAIGSVAFTIFVCVLLLLIARNARNASRASLITRSLDRERK